MGTSGNEPGRIREILRTHRKGLTIAEIARLLDLNRISTSKYLNMLLASGQAEMRVHGPARVFYPSQRVPLATILNMSTSLMLVMDESLTGIDVNTAFLDFFSLEKKEILGKMIAHSPVAAYFEPTLFDNLRQALESQDITVEIPVEIQGTEHFLRIKCIPTVFESGDTGVTLIGEDITELTIHRRHLEQLVDERSRELMDTNVRLQRVIENHKKARRELKESEKKYRELVENASSIIVKIDLAGKITFFNEYASAFFGFSEEEILGRSAIGTILPSRDHIARDLHQIHALLAGDSGASSTYVLEAVRKTGDRAWISWAGRRIENAKGEVTGMMVIGNDVTERKQAAEILEKSEQTLSAIVNFLPDATFVIDNNGTVIAWNRAMETMTGVGAREILGQGDYVYALHFFGERHPILIDYALHPEYKKILDRYKYEEREGQVCAEVFITRLPSGDATLWATAAPLYDSSGTLIGAIESIRDISALREAEREMPGRETKAMTGKDRKRSG